MTNEDWKPIEGFKTYEVSNLGRVRSMTRPGQTEWHVLSPVPRGKNDPRLYVMLRRDNKSHPHIVANLVASTWLSTVAGKEYVIFKDGDPTNAAVNNLEWADRTEMVNASRERNGTNAVQSPCKEDGCEEMAASRGLCHSHYYAFYRKNIFGSHKKPRWSTDEIGYFTAHERVRRIRGLVSNQQCIECGNQATDWALSVDGEFVKAHDNPALYSLDVNDYQPMCYTCHSAYDAANRELFKKRGESARVITVKRRVTKAGWKKRQDIAKKVKAHGSLSAVAAETGLHVSLISRYFSQAEGKNFRDWKKEVAA